MHLLIVKTLFIGVVVSLVTLITTILLTLVMIMIWRTPPVLVALYFIVYFVMEGVYVSAVSTKIPQGGWIPFFISFIFAFIMFGWFNGRHIKIQYELSQKVDRDRLRMLLSDPIIQRVPGVCFFYTNVQDGLTPILEHYIKNMKSLLKVTIFTTFRYLLVPRVTPHERIVVSKLGLKRVYRCVVQYGYADSLDLEGDDFVSQVIDRLRAHIQNGSDYAMSVTSELEEEMSDMEEAKSTGAVHVRGKTRFYVSKNCGWFDGYMLAFYEVLNRNYRSALPAIRMLLSQCVEVGMLYEVCVRERERDECWNNFLCKINRVCVLLLGIPSSWRVMLGEEAAYDGEGYPEDNQDEVLEPWWTKKKLFIYRRMDFTSESVDDWGVFRFQNRRAVAVSPQRLNRWCQLGAERVIKKAIRKTEEDFSYYTTQARRALIERNGQTFAELRQDVLAEDPHPVMRHIGPESCGSHHPELEVPFLSVLPGASPAFPIEVSSEYSPIPAQQFPASPTYASLTPEDLEEDPEEDPEESFDLGL
ncbi:probable potassium transporter 17 [Camellia sinensis]|uniref:probable potassium transporter 17 n=1 Tax=Camellia sinensis TaxID=4442 RepID=UPI0010360BA7|nr:probable potassium transporter 17 [Camellia sinensis]